MQRVAVLVASLVLVSTQASAGDCERVDLWRDGQRSENVCRADAEARGLTVVDLGDDWVPRVLALSAEGTGPGYRSTYLALAQERFADAGADAELAPADRYFEMYGIEPTLTVVASRLSDAARHRCHQAIDNAPLEVAMPAIGEESRSAARVRIRILTSLRDRLERARVAKRLETLDMLASSSAAYGTAVERLRTGEQRAALITTVQAHLECDRLALDRLVDGGYTWQTSNAVAAFQRGVMILPSEKLDAATLLALALDSRERDFEVALRVLRERVASASGLIEDGTAGVGESMVQGRELDPKATWLARGQVPLDDAAPDLISAATEATARALGWRDPASTIAFLIAHPAAVAGSSLVAIQLPPLPAYHTTTMELSIEIDRGDVRKSRGSRPRVDDRRPALVVYTTDGARRIPLARYPTTVGGWQDVQSHGDLTEAWKPSPVGPAIWQDLMVAPTWLPPESTPDRELVRVVDGRTMLAGQELGPSYRSAFGMLAFVHLVAQRERGRTVLEDDGIRSHATGNLASLANGVSHGCHRLLGRNAVRLADFVLAHHAHVDHGNKATSYRRVVRDHGSFPISIDSLGYRIELVTPIPVNVLAGRALR